VFFALPHRLAGVDCRRSGGDADNDSSATLRLTRRPDGAWGAGKLLPLPRLKPGQRPPQTIVENGVIEIFDPLKSPAATLSLREIKLTLTPLAGDSPAAAHADDRKVEGSFSGDCFRHVVFQGVVEPHRPGFALSGTAEGWTFAPSCATPCPAAWPRSWPPWGPFADRAK